MLFRALLLSLLGTAAILLTAAMFLIASVPHADAGQITCGRASYYGRESGHVTADGTPFDGTQMIAASRTLPFGTQLRVTYQNKAVIVTVHDRGPYVKGRFLDLSKAAAERIGMISAGVATVCAEVI